jgi:hypothetical protein
MRTSVHIAREKNLGFSVDIANERIAEMDCSLVRLSVEVCQKFRMAKKKRDRGKLCGAVYGIGFRIAYRRVFSDYFFLCRFFRPNVLRSRERARRSQLKSISGKVSAQSQMFATLPKSYNENQFLAHNVASLQACYLDPS